MLVPASNFVSNRSAIEALRTPGEGPGVRALYAKLPARSAIVAENYWLARLVNYMHFSGEVAPDPNPRVLDNDANDVRAAVADGLEVYAFEGATHWLNAQGLRFEKTDDRAAAVRDVARGAAAQARVIAAASAGRPLPFEWLPAASRAQSGRPPTTAPSRGRVGDASRVVEQQDSPAPGSSASSAPKAARSRSRRATRARRSCGATTC